MAKKNIFKDIKDQNVINLYHLNKSSFPPEIVEIFEKNYDFMYFLFNVTAPFLADLPDLVLKLMKKQYPVFRKEKRPTLVKEIESISTAVGGDFIQEMAALMNLKRMGKTIREHFDPFDQWLKDAVYPEDTFEKTTDIERSEYGISTDEEWEEIKENEDIFREEEMEWIKQRRFEFIDLLQSTFLQYFRGFELLSSDDLIFYSVLLRDEYEFFWEACENIEYFIDWGLSEEDYSLSDREKSEKKIALGNEKRWAVAELRYRRVDGEEV